MNFSRGKLERRADCDECYSRSETDWNGSTKCECHLPLGVGSRTQNKHEQNEAAQVRSYPGSRIPNKAGHNNCNE